MSGNWQNWSKLRALPTFSLCSGPLTLTYVEFPRDTRNYFRFFFRWKGYWEAVG